MVRVWGGRVASGSTWRLRALKGFFALSGLVMLGRLFMLQVVDAAWYRALAEGQHAVYEELIPLRGSVYVRDFGDETEYAVATNVPRAFVYADPRRIHDPREMGFALARLLHLDGWDTFGKEDEALAEEGLAVTTDTSVREPDAPTATEELIARLSKGDDPYEPIARNVEEETLNAMLALEIPGVDYVFENVREYPEKNFGGHVVGFLGQDDAGVRHGYYGIEGYFDELLAGRAGSLYAESDASGAWVGVGARSFTPAVDGGDILLTIDRTVQYVACGMLKDGVAEFQADGGALVIIEPETGRVLAICGAPDFDPRAYGLVQDVSVYNNPAIFTAYEAGSVMKPFTVAAALNENLISPYTTFEDTGAVIVDDYTIHNSDRQAHGLVTMTTALDESLNTAMVWLMRLMGRDTLARYFEDFCFGERTGIELATEVSGTIASLNEPSEVYAATASFGQGITLTPLQIAAAYGAIANGGKLMAPFVVDEIRHPDGTVEKRTPKNIRQVVSEKTATTVGAMLVSVVENGHGKRAAVDGYYIAGKTGTAQVAGEGGYLDSVTNGTFAGFGPVSEPRFAMVVKLENPKTVEWAESSAAPVFGRIAEFLLRYYDIPPERP